MKQSDQDTDDLQPTNARKPTYIKEQHNYNCQQFFGNITNCTFTMPAATPASSSSSATSSTTNRKRPKQKKAAVVPASEKPMTIRYFKHNNNSMLQRQRHRVDILYQKWTEWKWIDENTMPEDFDRLFEGSPCHCNITWTGTSATLTILLQELLKQSFVEKQTRCTAKYLVARQFGRTANSSRTRIDKKTEDRISFSVFILDTSNPLPERNSGNADEEDIQDSAFYEVCAGSLRATKGI